MNHSSRFKKMLADLREYETAAAQPKAAYFALTGKRDALKAAAQEVKTHIESDYQKEVAKKADGPHARGLAAAKQILADIAAAQQDRADALQTVRDQIADFDADYKARMKLVPKDQLVDWRKTPAGNRPEIDLPIFSTGVDIPYEMKRTPGGKLGGLRSLQKFLG